MTDNFARLLALMGGNGGGSNESIQVDTLPTPSADELGKIYQYIGGTTVNYTNGYFYKCVSETNPSTGVTTYSWVAIDTQEDTKHWIGTRAQLEVALDNGEIEDGTVILITDQPDVDNLPTEDSTNLVYSGGVWTALQDKNDVFQVSTMPSPSADNLGKIYQYVGTTTVTCTNGYFYEVVSDGGNPATYSWVRKNIQPKGLTVEEVSSLPTTNIKTDVIYLIPRRMTLNGYIDDVGDKFYVATEVTESGHTYDAYNQYVYSTGLYEDVISTQDAGYATIYNAIRNGTYTEGTCAVIIIADKNNKDEYINLDGTSGGWEKFGVDVDNAFSDDSANPVENRVITNAINNINDRIDSLKQVKAEMYYSYPSSSASTITLTQAQIDQNNGLIVDTSISPLGIVVEGTRGIDDISINVSGITKDGANLYNAFIPEWYISRVENYQTSTGDNITRYHVELRIEFYEKDEVRNMDNGDSITGAGGITYSKDQNGDYTIVIPKGFWKFYISAFYDKI